MDRPAHERQGFDENYRLGDTDASSTARQIGLASMAGYHCGNARMIVERSGDERTPGRYRIRYERKQRQAARGDNLSEP